MSSIFYWYRITIYRYYEQILKVIDIIKSLMGKNIDTFKHDHNVAKITYNRFGKEYNVYIPYNKKNNKRIKVFAKIPLEILDLDNQDKFEMVEITQQLGIPYMVTPNILGAEYIEVIENGIRKNNKIIKKFFGDEKIKF